LSPPLIVLDTDVVVTALIGREDASSYRVVHAAETGEVRLALSDAFLREVVEVVKRREVLIAATGGVGRAFEVALNLGVMGNLHRVQRLDWPSIPDPKDGWMLDLAWAAGADYIVAWDPHLTGADIPFPIEVVEPPQLLRVIAA
jgi:uncharacterized protein